MAEILTEQGKNGPTFHLSVNSAELDVIYRLLCATKQNADNTRLQIVNDIRNLIENTYVPTLDFETNVALSQDHFGMVCFKELEGVKY